MTSPSIRARLAAVVLAGAAALSWAHPAAAQTEQRTLTGERVAVYNLVGKLRVQPATGNQVVVDITRGGADARELKIESGDLRGANTLRVVYPADRIVYRGDRWGNSRTQIHVNSDGTFGDNSGRDRRPWGRDNVEIRSSGSGMDAYADLTVSVPKGQRIELHLGVGEATVANVTATSSLTCRPRAWTHTPVGASTSTRVPAA